MGTERLGMMLMFSRCRLWYKRTTVSRDVLVFCVHTHQTLDGLLDDICCHNVVQFVVAAQLGHHVGLPYRRRAQHTPTDWLKQEKMH